MSTKSAKGIAIDLPTLEIKRSLDADVLKSASFIREMVCVILVNKPVNVSQDTKCENNFLSRTSYTRLHIYR